MVAGPSLKKLIKRRDEFAVANEVDVVEILTDVAVAGVERMSSVGLKLDDWGFKLLIGIYFFRIS